MSDQKPLARQPDFDVGVLCKISGIKGRIGAAWRNDDGSINVQLNPFVQLPRQDGDLLVTLFPRKQFISKPPKFTGPPENDELDYMDRTKLKPNKELE